MVYWIVTVIVLIVVVSCRSINIELCWWPLPSFSLPAHYLSYHTFTFLVTMLVKVVSLYHSITAFLQP